MSDRYLAETLAEKSARVSLAPVNGLRPTAPTRPLSPNENVVVEGSGSARGLRPVAGEADEERVSLARRCELTERDIKIFSYLELYGAATLGQLWGIGFGSKWREDWPAYMFLSRIPVPKGNFSRADKRLRKLVDYGYLERRRWYSHIVFTLSPKGHWRLVKRGINKLSKLWKHGAREHEMGHTLLLGACATLLDRMEFSLESEREIRRDLWLEARKSKGRYRPKETMPDLYISSKAGVMGFELELSLKSKARYLEYWKNINQSRNLEKPHWLYVAGTPAIQKHLLALASEWYAPGLYFCDLESLIRDLDFTVFRNRSNWHFKLCDLRQSEFRLEGVPRDVREAWEKQSGRQEERWS